MTDSTDCDVVGEGGPLRAVVYSEHLRVVTPTGSNTVYQECNLPNP